MSRIFVKSFFIFFLFIILFFNLVYFFNLTGVLNQYTPLVDYHDKYFGFSTLFDFFTTGFREDNSMLVGYQQWLNEFRESYQNNIYGEWITFSSNGGIYSLETFFETIGLFFKSIGGFFQLLFYPLFLLIYIIGVIVWIVTKFFLLLGGLYYSYVPLDPYNLIHLDLIPIF